MILFKDERLLIARVVLTGLANLPTTTHYTSEILRLRVNGEYFLENIDQVFFLEDFGLVHCDRTANSRDILFTITEEGRSWLDIDRRQDFSDRLVHRSILEVLKAHADSGGDSVASKELLRRLKKHHPSLRLLQFEYLTARIRYLADKSWVEAVLNTANGKVLNFLARIKALGEDELARMAAEDSAVANADGPFQRGTGYDAIGPRYAYAHSIKIENLCCFEEADLEFQYPGRKIPGTELPAALPGFENINLIVGDNGSGKTTILKAVALAILGGALPKIGGFVPNWLVRADQAGATVKLELDTADGSASMMATVERRGSRETLGPWRSSAQSNGDLPDFWFSDDRPEYFLCGYGASSRRSEKKENFDQGARDKIRGARYQRIATLFEDGYSLNPLFNLVMEASSLYKQPNGQTAVSPHWDELVHILDHLLKETGVTMSRMLHPGDEFGGNLFFKLDDGLRVPFEALSDGFRGFLALIADLLSHLCSVAKGRLVDVPGIVLIDEIDQHLHPKWQRRILSTLSQTFPKLQFIVTTHSPILVGCLPADNIYVSERDEDGRVSIKVASEEYRGRLIDEILRGEYFNLDSTQDPETAKNTEEQNDLRAKMGREYLKNPSKENAQEFLRLLSTTEP